MSTDLTGCKIHIEQQLPSHIYLKRFYELSIYLKCNGVPKFLNCEKEVKLITSIITSDTKQKLSSPDFIFQNPSLFRRSGDTNTKFKILSLTNQFLSYRIQCEIPNSPVKKWISHPFTVVQYKFAMIRELKLIDGDKWYKDEGGKTNYLCFEMGLHENNTAKHEYVSLNRDIQFALQLVYFDDKSIVLNQNILKIDSDQTFILHKTMNKIEVRFKIEQVSSHHQKRRFCLKVIPINDATIGPCFSKPILVLSKRNKPKKTASHMSAQKRKEVATKKKNKNKKRKRNHLKYEIENDNKNEFMLNNYNNEIPLKKKRKLLSESESEIETESDNMSSDSNANHLDNNSDISHVFNNNNNNLLNNHNNYNNNNNNVNYRMQNECVMKPYHYPSIREYNKNPNTYFNHNYMLNNKNMNDKQKKRNIVKCLRLCCDTFSILSSRAMYQPFYGYFGHSSGTDNTMIYYCSFCHKFAQLSPQMIVHYEHCRVLKVMQLLQGENEKNKKKCDEIMSNTNSVPIPIDNGVEFSNNNSNSLAPKREATDIDINNGTNDSDGNDNNNSTIAMVNALLQNIPTDAFPINNNAIATNNFAAALNQLLQNATAPINNNNANTLAIHSNDNNSANTGFIFGGNNAKRNSYQQLMEFNNKK